MKTSITRGIDDAQSHTTMGDRPTNIPKDAERISFAGFESYGPFYRLAERDGVNRFIFAVAEKHMDGPENVSHSVLLGFTQGAMEATCQGGAVVSLSCDFVADAQAGESIEAHVKVVRRTRGLVFLTGELTAGGRVLLTANGLAKPTS